MREILSLELSDHCAIATLASGFDVIVVGAGLAGLCTDQEKADDGCFQSHVIKRSRFIFR